MGKPFDDSVYVAYHGTMFLKGAMDSHRTGMQVQFRLELEQDYTVFKDFSRKKKNKAGSGLYRCFFRSPDSESWGEQSWDLWFLRYNVGNHGADVTFEVADPSFWNLLRSMPAIDDGSEPPGMYVVMAQIGEDGKPVNIAARARLERARLKSKWKKGGPRSKHAARLCQDPDFAHYVMLKLKRQSISEEEVAEWVRKECGIDSRAQLDHDPQALERFEERVMSPYLRATT